MDKTLLIVGGAAAALYFVTRRAPPAVPTPGVLTKDAGIRFTAGGIKPAPSSGLTQLAAAPPSPKSIGTQVDEQAQTYAALAGEKGAQQLCGWLGAGSLSDQCGAVGSVAGEYAYQGAKKGVKAIGSAVEDAWNSIF